MKTVRRTLLGAVVAVVVAASTVLGWRLATSEATQAPPQAVQPADALDPAPSSPAPTAVILAALPQPIAPATQDYVDEPATEIGRLQIPAIGLDTALFEGISLTAIDHGPAHWPGTAMPGGLGNVVIAGHRITHSHPFRHLDRLVPGDQAVFTTIDGTFVYEFTGQEVVTPDRVDIADQTYEYRATFFACHPPGSARYRIVAHWRLVTQS